MLQVTHKLLLRSLSTFKSATKFGTAEMEETGKPEGMVDALMEMVLFCDRALRAQEDGEGSPLDTEVIFGAMWERERERERRREGGREGKREREGYISHIIGLLERWHELYCFTVDQCKGIMFKFMY